MDGITTAKILYFLPLYITYYNAKRGELVANRSGLTQAQKKSERAKLNPERTEINLTVVGYNKIMQWKHTILRLSVSTVLGVSGVAKIIDSTGFLFSLRYSLGLPIWSIILVASIIPLLEIGTAILVLFPTWQVFTVLLLRGLASAFVSYHIYLFISAETTACDCFGTVLNLDNSYTFAISCFLLLASFLLSHTADHSEPDTNPKKKQRIQESGYILAITIVGFLSLAVVRYSFLSRSFSVGILSKTDVRSVQSRLEYIFSPYIKEANDTIKVTVFLLIKSPHCEPCIDELTFWNRSALLGGVHLIAMYPFVQNAESIDIKKIYKLKYKVKTFNNELQTELFGNLQPFVARLLFSSDGHFIGFFRGNGTEEDKLKLVDTLKFFIDKKKPKVWPVVSKSF